MPSPFPGMNPYIEREIAWHDFHESFMPQAREMLNSQLLPRYIARIDERVYVSESPSDDAIFMGRGDVVVVEGGAGTAVAAPGAGLTTAEILQPAVDEERLAFIEIIDRETQRVVTIIELLSSSNKQIGPSREQYLAKQAKILRSDAHLVEIDLLRGGPRMPWRAIPECAYCVVISRVERRPRAELVTISLRDRLPSIPIPLKPDDPDAALDLQAVLHRIYDAAGYGYYIYRQPLDPPLGEADRAWAEKVAVPFSK